MHLRERLGFEKQELKQMERDDTQEAPNAERMYDFIRSIITLYSWWSDLSDFSFCRIWLVLSLLLCRNVACWLLHDNYGWLLSICLVLVRWEIKYLIWARWSQDIDIDGTVYKRHLTPIFQFASPPGFHVTHIPKGNLVHVFVRRRKCEEHEVARYNSSRRAVGINA